MEGKDFLVDDDYVEKVCKLGKGAETCRYLLIGKDGWECGKVDGFQETINRNFERGTMVTIGDNCAGITNVTGAA